MINTLINYLHSMSFCFSSLLLADVRLYFAFYRSIIHVSSSWMSFPLYCTLSGHQSLLLKTCDHKDSTYEEGPASSEMTPMTKPGTTMN
jgi:hypothetical protein